MASRPPRARAARRGAPSSSRSASASPASCTTSPPTTSASSPSTPRPARRCCRPTPSGRPRRSDDRRGRPADAHRPAPGRRRAPPRTSRRRHAGRPSPARRLDDLVARSRRPASPVDLARRGQRGPAPTAPSTRRPTASCRRRSPTCCVTPGPATPRSSCATSRRARRRDLDDGTGADAGPADARGHGLVGMRERVAAVRRRRSTASARPGGGFAVPARLPADDDRGSSSSTTRSSCAPGLRAILEVSGVEVVGEAGDGAEAVALAAQPAARRRADGRAHAGARRHRGDPADPAGADGDAPRVLVLTTFDLDEYVFEALRAGASGFLLKDTPRRRAGAGDRGRRRRRALLAPSATRRLVEDFARRPRHAAHRSRATRSRSSPPASATCSSSWRGACRTARSPPTSSSVRPR